MEISGRLWCEGAAQRCSADCALLAGCVTSTRDRLLKTELARDMVTGHAVAGTPFGWVTGDEVYGRSRRLREACEDAEKGYVFAIPVNFKVTLPSGRKIPAGMLAGLIPATAWQTRSCGRGCKGHRHYHWAWAATASPRHWVLIRRSIADPADLAFFYCHAPAGRPDSLGPSLFAF